RDGDTGLSAAIPAHSDWRNLEPPLYAAVLRAPRFRGRADMQSETTGVAGGTVATDETDRLIASDKVEGTAVYNRAGARLGPLYLESGSVSGFGGPLGSERALG